MNLSRQASVTKVPTVPGPVKVKQARPSSYQRPSTQTSKQMNFFDSARNNLITSQDTAPETIDELFNGIGDY